MKISDIKKILNPSYYVHNIITKLTDDEVVSTAEIVEILRKKYGSKFRTQIISECMYRLQKKGVAFAYTIPDSKKVFYGHKTAIEKLRRIYGN